MLEIGCGEIAVADTIGCATPGRIDMMLTQVIEAVPVGRLACHFHDTSGQALANVDVALKLGVRSFDSAVGGLGGCPYAPGAAGNLATKRLVQHLQHTGFVTSVDPAKLRAAVAHTLSFADLVSNIERLHKRSAAVSPGNSCL
ncbi:hypothetical protein [Mesorhizobium sp. B2-7-1]|uniref:hypothetical protein n=1 Tax=Mesorhizobium sp. B2-7-1 TaxID=2589909 RepID=UPI001FED94D0|nr:hypothetical protein [Mesorhizobium sp. B2-7-1]